MHASTLEKIQDIHPVSPELFDEAFYPVVSSASTARLTVRTGSMDRPRQFINFATSNYLGFGQHPAVIEAVKSALDHYGLGANSSPVLSGYFDVHQKLERGLAELLERDDALLFPSGCDANEGALSALVGKNDVVLLDTSCHGSLFVGASLSGARIRYYRHQDFEELDWLLKRFSKEADAVWVAICGVFSMAGELERLPELLEVTHRHGASTILDDAHGLGVVGERGQGTLEHYGLPPASVDVHMGTLSKTLAGVGGFIAADASVVRYLRFNAKSHVLTASIPPAVAAGCLASLRLLREEGAERARELRRKANLFRELCRERGLDAQGEDTGIIPIPVPDEDRIWHINNLAREQGIFLNPVVFPGVPKGEGRLRFTVTYDHADEDLELAADVVGRAAEQCDDC